MATFEAKERQREIASLALVVLHVARGKMEGEGLAWMEALNGAELQLDPPFADQVAALIHRVAEQSAERPLSTLVCASQPHEQGELATRVLHAIARESGLALEEELLRWECEQIARRVFHDQRAVARTSEHPSAHCYSAEVTCIDGARVLDLARQPGQTRREALERLWHSLRAREADPIPA